jgi:hypothetical protein
MTDTRLPAAGWFPDPAGSHGERWWTGAVWSEHVRPFQPQVAQAAPELSIPIAAEPSHSYSPARNPEPAPAAHYRPMAATAEPLLGVIGTGRLKNVLAYRSVNFGVTTAILFVFSVISADLAVHALPFVWMIFISLALMIVGTAIAVTGVILSVISLFRVPTFLGLGPALTGLVFGVVFSFTIPLVRLTVQFLLTVVG